jgi:hypothetical protein
VSNINESGVPAFTSWNENLFKRFNLSFTGFVINGDAGILTADDESIYDSFSPAGIVISPDKDHRGMSLNGAVTPAGTPVIHHVLDVPGGNVTAAAAAVASIVTSANPPSNATDAVQFGVFRTILQVIS